MEDVITTERLVLRRFTSGDYDDLFEFLFQLRDDEFEPYPGITYESCAEQLAQRVGSNEYFAAVLKETGKVIGNIYCGVREYDAREIGYIINENYRRRGCALEALTAVTLEAFRSGVHRVYARCDPRNPTSWGLLERAGYMREAHLRQNVWFFRDAEGNPVWKDTYVYAMLREDV